MTDELIYEYQLKKLILKKINGYRNYLHTIVDFDFLEISNKKIEIREHLRGDKYYSFGFYYTTSKRKTNNHRIYKLLKEYYELTR